MFPVPQLVIPGIVAVLIAFLILLSLFRSRSTTSYVRMHGINVSATVTRVDAELVTRHRKPSYFIYADWEDPSTHIVYHFKGEASGARVPLNHPPGSRIDVRIDPKNPARYEVVMKADDPGSV
jgi:hypothetical protein